jgi:hypothetical protein
MHCLSSGWSSVCCSYTPAPAALAPHRVASLGYSHGASSLALSVNSRRELARRQGGRRTLPGRIPAALSGQVGLSRHLGENLDGGRSDRLRPEPGILWAETCTLGIEEASGWHNVAPENAVQNVSARLPPPRRRLGSFYAVFHQCLGSFEFCSPPGAELTSCPIDEIGEHAQTRNGTLGGDSFRCQRPGNRRSRLRK